MLRKIPVHVVRPGLLAALQVQNKGVDFAEWLHTKYASDVVGYDYMGQRQYSVVDINLVKEIFTNPTAKSSPAMEALRYVVGNTALVTRSHADWLEKRKYLNDPYAAVGGRTGIPIIQEVTIAEVQKFFERWDSKAMLKVNIVQESRLLSFNIIAGIMTAGRGVSAAHKDAILSAVDSLVLHVAANAFLPKGLASWVSGRTTMKIKQAYAALSEIVMLNNQSSTKKWNMIDILQEYVAAGKITQQQMLQELFVAFGAGFETTANLFCRTVFISALQPEQLTALAIERDNVCGNSMLPEHVDSLIMSQHFAEEIRRMYPPVWVIARESMNPVSYQDTVLPAGTAFSAPLYYLNRSSTLFEDPEVFDLFRHQEVTSLQRRMIDLTFGGSRPCLGEHIARNAIGIFATLFADNYDVQLSVDHMPKGEAITTFGIGVKDGEIKICKR